MIRWQRLALGIAALIAWGLLECVAVAANVKFAWTLGHTDLERYILAAGSVASDLLKAAAPVAFLYFVATKRNWAATSTFVMGFVAVCFSFASALGFVSGERFHAYYSAEAAVQATKDARAEIKKQQADRDWLPVHKPVAVLKAEQAAMEGDRNFRQTSNCANAKGTLEEWCRTYRQLGVSIAAAQAASEADAAIAKTRDKIEEKGRDYTDPQITVISNIIGVDQMKVLVSLIILVVLLIELGSTLGLTIALGLLTPPDSDTKVGKVLGKAFSVITGDKGAKDGPAATPTPAAAKAPAAPSAEAVSRAVPIAAGKSFKEPVAVKPDADGLRSKLKPIPRVSAMSAA
ncbi:hypothetical protein [uncultured Hyphomicrobium sp.]|uniref:hypothetical protein n=1 Tax=uncultured Hyphomicrobium sp. TaxID=194373 RepID=UPI0025D8A8F2|nr:hypothetical protein [uncultured Hyphomicrobium sp.]